jgi:hypothetical protein
MRMLKLLPRISLRSIRAPEPNPATCVLLTVGALTGSPAFCCSSPLQPMQQIELMFGRNVHGWMDVSNGVWTRFLAREITPRFPDGVTVLDAAGQWRDPASGRLARERSRLVIIVTAAMPSTEGRIAAIVAAYKRQFHQKSVGVVTIDVCAGF